MATPGTRLLKDEETWQSMSAIRRFLEPTVTSPVLPAALYGSIRLCAHAGGLAEENDKPDAKRCRSLTNARRAALLGNLYSTAPIYDALQR